ncbi:MAG: Gfo/Idh/MocA family oxidoreductase, partial [Candidatus Microthrix parvicella]
SQVNGCQRNLAIIGVGLHATKTYLPTLAQHKLVRVPFVVELDERLDATRERLAPFRSTNFSPEVVGIPGGSISLTPSVVARLDSLVDEHDLDALIVSTGPDTHGEYLRWGVQRGLSILVDKPVLGGPGATVDPEVAPALLKEFDQIVALVDARPDILVSVATQRDWHPGFRYLREIIAEASERFQCPVTGIGSSHDDGQLRLPHELGSIAYHGYMDGMGKAFHSLYHELRVQADIIGVAADNAGMSYNEIVTTAATVRPRGFLRSLPRPVWQALFGADLWADTCPEADAEMLERYRGFGEIDIAATTSFVTEGDTTLVATVEGRHNSFSRRTWLEARPDLYKCAGRTKHEGHTIHVGPFMTVHVTSWQAKDRHEHNDSSDYEPGGNSHFTLDIFRNADWWPAGTPVMETIDAAKIAANAGLSSDQLLMSQAKSSMLLNFVDCLTGRRPIHANPSPITGHRLAMHLLLQIAESAATSAPVRAPVSALWPGPR